jgi:hypothetical protein
MLVFSKLLSFRSCFGTLKMRDCVKINLDQSVGIHKIIWTTDCLSCFSNLLKCSTCSMFSYFVDLNEIFYTKGIIALHRLYKALVRVCLISHDPNVYICNFSWSMTYSHTSWTPVIIMIKYKLIDPNEVRVFEVSSVLISVTRRMSWNRVLWHYYNSFLCSPGAGPLQLATLTQNQFPCDKNWWTQMPLVPVHIWSHTHGMLL